MKKIFIFLLVAVALPYSFVDAADYSVTPLIIEHDIVPRDSFEETVKITNTTGRPLRLFPTVNDITLGDEGAIETFIPASMGDNSTSVTSWIAVTRARVEIAPGETIKIPITVKVSPTAAPGEYHAFIGFAEGSKRDEAEAIVMSGRAPGVIVRLSLVEKRTEYLRLQRFSVDRLVTNTDTAQVNYTLENVGGLPLVPTGEIIFYDGNGVELTTMPVNPEQKNILAGKTEIFSHNLPEVGTIGRYKAFLNVEYGTNQRANLYDTAYFNVLPIRLLLITFFVLLLLSTILAILFHRSRNQVTEGDQSVAVYVRSGKIGVEKDHDINLKN